MERAERKCNDAAYNLDLVGLGFVQTEIDKLGTYAAALDDANEAQEEFKGEIKVNTEARIQAYNKVWESMAKVSAASKQVFADDFAKLSLFKLYPEGQGGLGKPQNITAVVDPADPTHVNVDFDAVQDATEYRIYQSLVPVGNPPDSWTELTTGAINHFDVQLTTGKRNYWKVRAYSATMSSPYSDEVWLDA
jgi:hypothetical protein